MFSINRTSLQGMLPLCQAASTSLVQPYSFIGSQSRIEAMATTFEGTDAPHKAVVVKRGWKQHNATASGAPDNQWSHCSRKQVLTLSAWNVRTTNDSDSSLRPEQETALICREYWYMCSKWSPVSWCWECCGKESHYFLEWRKRENSWSWFCHLDRLAGQGITPTPVNDWLMLLTYSTGKWRLSNPG